MREGLRERREMRDRINALISAQMRDDEALTQYKVRTEEAFARLANAQADTDEKLNAFIANTDEALAQFGRKTDEETARLTRAQANTEEKLSAFIVNTDEKLNAFIDTVKKLVSERREEEP